MKNIYILIPVLIMFFSLRVNAQDSENEFSGKVYTASNGELLPMATVTVIQPNGIKKQEFTGFEGEFTVTSTFSELLLEVSFPGYFTKKVYVKTGIESSIYLVSDKYPSVNKKYTINGEETSILTSQYSVATFDNVKHNRASETIDDLVKGLSGVYAEKRSGMPGEGSNILIRGINTLNALHNPLIVVDGMIFGAYSFDIQAIDGNDYFTALGINPNDVKEIIVLKDAAATAIYGLQGANGVIQITTQQVAMGQTTINFKGTTGVTWDDQRLPMLNASQHKTLLQEQLFSQDYTLTDIESEYPFLGASVKPGDYPVYDHNTDWQDELYDLGIKTDFHLGLKGGDETAKFYGAVGYTHNEGAIKNTDFDRFSLRFNSNVNVTNKFSMDASFAFSRSENGLLEQSTSHIGNPLYAALYKTPMQGVLQSLGDGVYNNILEDADVFGYSNPIALTENARGRRKSYFVTGNVDFAYRFKKELELKVLVGTELNQTDEAYFRPDYGVGQLEGDGTFNYVATKADKYRSLVGDIRLKYDRLFGHEHKLFAKLGVRGRISEIKTANQWGANTVSDQFRTLSGADENTIRKIGNWEKYNSHTFYLNSNYNFRNKIFISASASLDASTPIGRNANGDLNIGGLNMGLFYGVGIGYDLAQEVFMNSLSWIDILKIKANYGKTGNDMFASYLAKDHYVGVQFYNVSGLTRSSLMNDEIKWEDTYSYNIGLDASMLNERLNIGATYYNRKTKDALVAKDADEITGFEYVFTNEGTIKSDGIEFDLNYQVFDRDFKWNIGASITKSSTTIDKIPNDEVIDVTGGWKINRVNEAPGSFYGHIYEGVFSSEAEANNSGLVDQFGRSFKAGDAKFKDLITEDTNNDGIPDAGDGIIDEKDRTVIGNPFPEYYGSLINNFKYKNWGLYIRINFVEGRDVFNYARYRLEAMDSYGNQTAATLSRWNEEGDITNVPQAVYGDPMGNSRFSTRWIEDGSYIRLQDVTLSYDFKIESSWLKSAQVYVTGQNLLVLTDYLGNDPEFYSGSSIYGMGIDYFKSPNSPLIMGGVKIGF